MSHEVKVDDNLDGRVVTEVRSTSNGESFAARVDGKLACSMSTGGPHLFATQAQAEHHGRQYLRGWIGGTYLSSEE